MILIPAVDISRGQCVRLIQGDPKRRIVYFQNPVEAALHWQEQGAQYLHVVDLDSALEIGENCSSIKRILEEVSIPVQVGGGLRSVEEAERILNWGASRIILGTVAITNPSVVKEAVRKLGQERVVIAIDQRAGKVAIKGWREATSIDHFHLAKEMEKLKIGAILYSSIEQDGLMQGPDVKGIAKMVQTVKTPVIAAGGISKLSDVLAVNRTGATGLVLGRAIYDNAFTLQEALKEVSKR